MAIYIPYTDYSLTPGDLKKEILLEIGRILQFKNTQDHEDYVKGVEANLAKYFQTKFAVAVDSGTTALQLSLTALGVGQGDEVIVPTYTYVATALAVTNIGARPVFVDIKPGDWTIDPDLIESSITSRTKAVIPVHIHGFCCDMEKIRQICQKYKIALVEDASQSHGATIHGQKTGSFGIGCFSLHTSKNLGGIGDAGLIVLNDEDIYRKIQEFLVPDSGSKAVLAGRRTPCTMDAIQAAIIQKRLVVLDRINDNKRAIANQYDALIDDSGIIKPAALAGTSPVYRDYFILAEEDRDELRSCLFKEGIETKLAYNPLHLSKTFEDFTESNKNFPVAETVARRGLLLPSFWGMTESQLKRVCAVLNGSRNVRA